MNTGCSWIFCWADICRRWEKIDDERQSCAPRESRQRRCESAYIWGFICFLGVEGRYEFEKPGGGGVRKRESRNEATAIKYCAATCKRVARRYVRVCQLSTLALASTTPLSASWTTTPSRYAPWVLCGSLGVAAHPIPTAIAPDAAGVLAGDPRRCPPELGVHPLDRHVRSGLLLLNVSGHALRASPMYRLRS